MSHSPPSLENSRSSSTENDTQVVQQGSKRLQKRTSRPSELCQDERNEECRRLWHLGSKRVCNRCRVLEKRLNSFDQTRREGHNEEGVLDESAKPIRHTHDDKEDEVPSHQAEFDPSLARYTFQGDDF